MKRSQPTNHYCLAHETKLNKKAALFAFSDGLCSAILYSVTTFDSFSYPSKKTQNAALSIFVLLGISTLYSRSRTFYSKLINFKKNKTRTCDIHLFSGGVAAATKTCATAISLHQLGDKMHQITAATTLIVLFSPGNFISLFSFLGSKPESTPENSTTQQKIMAQYLAFSEGLITAALYAWNMYKLMRIELVWPEKAAIPIAILPAIFVTFSRTSQFYSKILHRFNEGHTFFASIKETFINDAKNTLPNIPASMSKTLASMVSLFNLCNKINRIFAITMVIIFTPGALTSIFSLYAEKRKSPAETKTPIPINASSENLLLRTLLDQEQESFKPSFP